MTTIADQLAQDVKNSLCIDGSINGVLDAIMQTNSPDAMMALLTGLAHQAVDRALAAYRQSTTPAQATVTCYVSAAGTPPDAVGLRLNEKAEWVATPAQTQAAALYEAIKHGDDAHKAWLREAVAAWFNGQPVPPPVMSAQAPAHVPCGCANVGQCDGSCAPYVGGGGVGLVQAPAQAAEPSLAFQYRRERVAKEMAKVYEAFAPHPPEPAAKLKQRGFLLEWPTARGRETIWSETDSAAKAIGCPCEPVYAIDGSEPATTGRRPISDTRLLNGWLDIGESGEEAFRAFKAGVRFAEKSHHIAPTGSAAPTGGEHG
jgi:hypothetical protein